MAAGIWFWIIFVLCCIGIGLGFYFAWPVYGVIGIVFILLGLLGYKVFGGPVQ